jgi:hypothetical protein
MAMKELGACDLLGFFGFEPEKTKMVRHQDKRFNISKDSSRELIEAYQAYQNKPVFDNIERIVSFTGWESTSARFIGVYSIHGRKDGHLGALAKGLPETLKNAKYFYEIHHEKGYEALEGRLIIDWGKAAQSWHQKTRNKRVIEIRRSGHSLDVFKDYLEFTLTHVQLCDIIRNPENNHEWKSRLTSVAGVYLILDAKTGRQYVGSAYGSQGIWGRWRGYASSGHNNNKQLKRLVQSGADYPGSFVYSILQILPNTTSKSEVISWEGRHKEKLGTRATGLNSN